MRRLERIVHGAVFYTLLSTLIIGGVFLGLTGVLYVGFQVFQILLWFITSAVRLAEWMAGLPMDPYP